MTTQPFSPSADGPSLLAVAVPALALAAVLICAFAWGSHLLVRRRPPKATRREARREPREDGPPPHRRAS
ncbi:hypothetical protein [Kitasatospora brasiliensis]|uniref:hypothetical protein n=1 Tax=Kitasatospora brasiliensis TaxID=3058040 RepID=UPI00292E9A30|nr:hypothetical protein [Kitasatospora sp. K002]